MIIGDEHQNDQMRHCSVVVARYGLADQVSGVLGVVGGRVHGAWRGLDPMGLLDGDLPASNDYRTVLAEILEKRCGVAGSTVFPGLGSRRIGLAVPR